MREGKKANARIVRYGLANSRAGAPSDIRKEAESDQTNNNNNNSNNGKENERDKDNDRDKGQQQGQRIGINLVSLKSMDEIEFGQWDTKEDVWL